MSDRPDPPAPARSWSTLEPLRERDFRTIWTSSLFSNFGVLILGVGAAWDMTRLAGAPSMVALVQTALMLPAMIVSVPAGAIADMFDRRKVALVGLVFAFLSAALLTALSALGYTTPWLLLAFCTLIGAGGSLYGPAWQASVREQVTPEHLPAAIALQSVSYNVARSFGPALGGVIVLVAGARAAFALNAICYLPLIGAFFFWRRPAVPSRLPPERLDRAIVSGLRYAIHSSPIRTVIIRALLTGAVGASLSALVPVIARDMLGGSAGTYGLLLGLYGAGAVVGALAIAPVRERMSTENAVRITSVITGIMALIVGWSHSVVLTAVAMLVAGCVCMLLASMLNLGVQLSAPRWVTARALSWYLSALTGGIAIGSWLWGELANEIGVGPAMMISGVAIILKPLVGFVLPLPEIQAEEAELVEIGRDPDVVLALTGRSGPVVIEIDYHVDPEQARPFYNVMLEVRRARSRNGAFDWSISRDIADPAMWTERYVCPTWADYLRQRSRFTIADRVLHDRIHAFRTPDREARVRRKLERPFGSVRWRADTPDPAGPPMPIYTP